MQPLISVIIPTFNRASVTGESLDSVLAQTYQNWECIIVDDGSTDYSAELFEFYCEKDSRFKTIKREALPKGAPHCRNIGLSHAAGEYCIFLDSDDLLLEFCIERRVHSIADFPDMDFWVFPMLIQGKGREPKKQQIPEENTYLKDFLSYNVYWQTMCTLWDVNFIKALKGFNPQYPRLNDPEVHIRAMLYPKVKYLVCSEKEPDSIYRYDMDIKNKEELAQKYFQSLCLFIPDISGELSEKKKEVLSPLLLGYLRDYMKVSFLYNSRRENQHLFKIFYNCRIMSRSNYLKLVSYYYAYVGFERAAKKVKKRINDLLYSHL